MQSNNDVVDDFQTLHTPVCHLVRQDRGGHGELATERMEASGGSPTWQSFVQVDINEEEPETLEGIDPHWRAMRWLQVAVQGITDEEVPWYELVTPLTSGAEGAALSLAKRLVVAWQWKIKVHREDDCPPALSILNIGQFITDEEIAGAWESHTGSWPTPVHCSGWVRQPVGENGSGPGGRLRSKPPHWYVPFGA